MKRGENLAARREYAEEHPSCEIAPLYCHAYGVTGLYSQVFQREIPAKSILAQEIHHIIGGVAGCRWDHPLNFMAVCSRMHEHIERRHYEGLVLCVWRKHLDGALAAKHESVITGEPVTGVQFLSEIYGKNLIGVLENADAKLLEFPEKVVHWRDALVRIYS